MHGKQAVLEEDTLHPDVNVTQATNLHGAFSTQFVCAVGNNVTVHRLHGNVRATLSNALVCLHANAHAHTRAHIIY